MVIFLFNFGLATILFLLINWIGRHAAEFGYTSTTLFEDANESIALNFIIRCFAPAVFIVAVSAAAVALGYAWLRIGIYQSVIIYFVMRVAAVLALRRQLLISWPRLIVHVAAGVAIAMLAYGRLIIPNTALLPNLETAGNELWLAILAFLYAVANKVQVQPEPGASRRNRYIRARFDGARARYSALIVEKLSDPTLQLAAYAILIYEDYCRPPAFRAIERLAPRGWFRTVGEMQVVSLRPISDRRSVEIGIDLLRQSWDRHSAKPATTRSDILWQVIADYNKDENYILKIYELMEIIAIRIEPQFEAAYRALSE